MRKVLIIGYFSPFRGGGSGRMLGLAKYLKEFGWEPYILTAPLEKNAPENFNVFQVNYRGDIFWFIRKMFRLFFGFKKEKSTSEQIRERIGVTSKKSIIDYTLIKIQEVLGYPDTEKNWINPAIVVAEKIIKEQKIDALLSVWPITSHIIASRLKEKYNIPWVADFPDPWSQNHAYPYGKIRKIFDEKLELKTIKNATLLTAASPEYAKKQENLHERAVTIITNGFDPDLLNNKRPPLTKEFTITYTGTIYKGKQDPIKILEALSLLIKKKRIEKGEVNLRFYSTPNAWITEEIEKRDLKECVFQFDFVSKDEAFQKEMESQILLLLGWEDTSNTGVYPMKTFEYLAAERPILITGGVPNEDIKKIVSEMNSGVSGETIENVCALLLSFYEEYKKNGKVSYCGKKENIEKYSSRTMAKKFCSVFDTLIS